MIDEDIRAGIPASVSDCPIAKAVLRENPGITGVQVGGVFITAWEEDFRDEQQVTCYLLPYEARIFVGLVDSHLPVEPFKFTAEEYHGSPEETILHQLRLVP